MEIRLAKTAGFCFGVNRAVELTYNLLDEGHKVATLGPLIHNPQAVADMERRGALVADTVDDIPAGYEVIIRSHGVPRSTVQYRRTSSFELLKRYLEERADEWNEL